MMTDRGAFNTGLLEFLAEAVTPFHAAQALERRFCEAGFVVGKSLEEAGDDAPGLVFRRGGTLIALRRGSAPLMEQGLRMVGAHTDSPCLMIKPQPEQREVGYRQLGVEVYGGALLNPWFDRDLSIAGRVSFAGQGGAVQTALVDFRRPIAVIPSLAIHLDREANSSRSVNAQTQMAPILGLAGEEEWDLRSLLTAELAAGGLSVGAILDFELCCYDTQAPALVGLQEEFIASARLDNLLSCYVGMQALFGAAGSPWSLLVCNDHEEVGSQSASGAQGPMLRDFLGSLLPRSTDLPRLMDRSMMISADNAHGVHPNYRDRHDPQHGPRLNGGPVIKVNASQRYASSSDGAGLFRLLAGRLDLPVQSFAMRADMACGSTIGPITAGELGVTTLDVGVPTFAMHSIRELAGSEDAWSLARILEQFFAQPGPLFAAAENG
jgi:aspartyl aminopeptidase